MEIDFVHVCFYRKLRALYFSVSRVEETFVSQPSSTRKFNIGNGFVYFFFGNCIDDDNFLPIASSFRNIVSGKGSFLLKDKPDIEVVPFSENLFGSRKTSVLHSVTYYKVYRSTLIILTKSPTQVRSLVY